MTLICAGAAVLGLIAGCGTSTGTIGAGGGPTDSAPTTSAPTGATSGSTTANPATSSAGTTTASPADNSSPASDASTTTAPNPATSSAAPAGKWQPTGELANAEPVDESVGPDKKVTVLWPKGQAADHALTITLLAKRKGDKLDVTMHALNNSGQKVSLLTGAFGGADALDETGQGLKFDDFNDDWTLKDPSDSPYLSPNDPLNGVIVIDAPKAGSTFNLFWTQAVNIGGIILVRDIPITG
ncbi:MAG: hypothetical protein HOV87_03105 [Catenulispora sp.]|nr:hypothetical protein [Catenulispora sp.]